MNIAEPALSFWLDFVEAEGGLWEARSEAAALALLPAGLQTAFHLSDTVLVSADPEIEREEGGLLLIHGHTVLDQAASQVLDRGDVGRCYQEWPRPAPPSAQELVARARERFSIDHGRIDPGAGVPYEVYLPVLRVGVIVHYALSLDDSFQEREEVWVDACSSLELPEVVSLSLSAVAVGAQPDRFRHLVPSDLAGAVRAGHRVLDARANARSKVLARYSAPEREKELAQAAAYYEAALDSIARRKATAGSERARLLDAQAEVTRAERIRRLAEVEERFRPRHEIRPFRLHLVGVPALCVPVHVRRGSRLYHLVLTWLLHPGRFAEKACPNCGAPEPLVAGRERMGCRACLPRSAGPSLEAVPPPSGVPRPAEHSSRSANGIAASPDHSSPPAASTPQAASPRGRAGPKDRAAAPKQPSGTGVSSRRPGAQRADRIQKAGNKMAVSFWGAASGDERWRRKQTAPCSPLACLHRLYGASGGLWAAGLAPGMLPSYVNATTADPIPARPEATTGSIVADGLPFSYTLRWFAEGGVPVVGEVLPFPMAAQLRLPPWSWVSPEVEERLRYPPPPRVELDEVEAALWRVVVPSHGLAVALRCLALREWASRLEAFTHPAPALAAALLKVTATRSGRRMTVEESASGFAADLPSVRKLVFSLQKLIRQAHLPW